jgi:hypothetical protein
MADAIDPRKRWDTDERFTGVADASLFAAGLERLAALARRPGWVAEDPEVHLVPHLRGARVAGLLLLDWRSGEDGVLDVTAQCSPGDSRRDIRRRAWALIGTIAEPMASVREHRAGDAVIFDVITGIPDDPGPFATHGHALRLTLVPPNAPSADGGLSKPGLIAPPSPSQRLCGMVEQGRSPWCCCSGRDQGWPRTDTRRGRP